jgi:hypothetical protein
MPIAVVAGLLCRSGGDVGRHVRGYLGQHRVPARPERAILDIDSLLLFAPLATATTMTTGNNAAGFVSVGRTPTFRYRKDHSLLPSRTVIHPSSLGVSPWPLRPMALCTEIRSARGGADGVAPISIIGSATPLRTKRVSV